MKHLILIFTLAAILLPGTASCSKWLEATSSSQTSGDKLYGTRDGFHNAVAGVYLNLCSPYSHSSFIGWETVDIACWPYQELATGTLRRIQEHSYDNRPVAAQIWGCWQALYQNISQINLTLRELERRRDVISSDIEYRLIRGEMLGLRAYLHFELIRLFGPAGWTGELAGKMTVPYATVYSKEPPRQRTAAETAQLLLDDVEESLRLLSLSDPLVADLPESFENSINADGFWNYRQSHFNYFAAEALAARIHLWGGNHGEAARCAQDVIDRAFDCGLVSWVDAEEQRMKTNNDEKDWTFSTEHIFRIQANSTLFEDAPSEFLMPSDPSKGLLLGNSLVDNILYVRLDPVTGSMAGAEDLRGPSWMLRFAGSGYQSYKLYSTSTSRREYRHLRPLIRISEMYYIVAEKRLQDGDTPGALGLLNTVRLHRGISDDLPDTADGWDELTKEYYREFINEGQVFPFLKRTGCTHMISGTTPVTPKDLIFPFPSSEIIYGRVQER